MFPLYRFKDSGIIFYPTDRMMWQEVSGFNVFPRSFPSLVEKCKTKKGS
jgi:hypothetical protein